jgi:hypothetical protein
MFERLYKVDRTDLLFQILIYYGLSDAKSRPYKRINYYQYECFTDMFRKCEALTTISANFSTWPIGINIIEVEKAFPDPDDGDEGNDVENKNDDANQPTESMEYDVEWQYLLTRYNNGT